MFVAVTNERRLHLCPRRSRRSLSSWTKSSWRRSQKCLAALAPRVLASRSASSSSATRRAASSATSRYVALALVCFFYAPSPVAACARTGVPRPAWPAGPGRRQTPGLGHMRPRQSGPLFLAAGGPALHRPRCTGRPYGASRWCGGCVVCVGVGGGPGPGPRVFGLSCLLF